METLLKQLQLTGISSSNEFLTCGMSDDCADCYCPPDSDGGEDDCDCECGF